MGETQPTKTGGHHLLMCVCVNHLNRCKTSTLIDGIAFPYHVLCHYNEPVLNILPSVYPISFSIAGGVTVDFLVTPTKLWKSIGWKFGRKLLYLQCRSWAHSSRSWGTRHTVFYVVVSLRCQVTTKPLPEDFSLIRLSQSVSAEDSFWPSFESVLNSLLSIHRIHFDSLSSLVIT